MAKKHRNDIEGKTYWGDIDPRATLIETKQFDKDGKKVAHSVLFIPKKCKQKNFVKTRIFDTPKKSKVDGR